jgi:hypothetical protein
MCSTVEVHSDEVELREHGVAQPKSVGDDAGLQGSPPGMAQHRQQVAVQCRLTSGEGDAPQAHLGKEVDDRAPVGARQGSGLVGKPAVTIRALQVTPGPDMKIHGFGNVHEVLLG